MSRRADSEPRFSYLIGRIDRGLRKRLLAVLEEFDLSIPEYAALSVLRNRPGLSNAQLARRSLITPQSMIHVIGNLERRDLIVREVDPIHARILRARLTESGASILKSARTSVDKLETELLLGVPAEHREIVVSALTTVMQRLRSDARLEGERNSS